MQKIIFLLLTIFIMHVLTLVNILLFKGDWNGIVMGINTILLVLAFGVVLPIKNNHQSY